MAEENAARDQRKLVTTFLASVGINFDLVDTPYSFTPAPPVDEYTPPADLELIHTEQPIEQALDLFQCSVSRDHTYTVEGWAIHASSTIGFVL